MHQNDHVIVHILQDENNCIKYLGVWTKPAIIIMIVMHRPQKEYDVHMLIISYVHISTN